MMNNCEKCKFRAKYDQNPRSLLGRIWKWHIGWCPGWKSYLKSLSDAERQRIKAHYSLDRVSRCEKGPKGSHNNNVTF